MEKWQAEMAAKAARRQSVTALACALLADKGATAKAAQAKLAEWRPDERIARGSSHTKTRKAHQMCSGDGQCGTTASNHCGGRYWAARTNISFCKGDASLKIAAGAKTRAHLKTKLGC